MITDPNLILLDEPTSGLDSTTSLKIIKMMKREAVEKKLTVIATIHQPSADLFRCIDQVLLLEQGHQIYQGPTRDIKRYLDSILGCKMPKYQNPADYIIKMGQAP